MAKPGNPVLSDDPEVEPEYRIEESNIRENWPSNKNIGVLLTFDTQGAIDGAREGHQTATWESGATNWWDWTERSYGIKCALPRILDMLDRHDITATFPVVGMTVEWYRDSVEEIVHRGHEVANHTYSHRLLVNLDEEEERMEIEKSTEIIEELIGEKPKGWRSPAFSTSSRTIDILCESGYMWDSGFFNRDLPYVLKNGDNKIVELPVNLDDWQLFLMGGGGQMGMHMGGYPRGTTKGVLNVLKSEFDYLYEEAKTVNEPRFFNFTMHPKIIGRPHRAKALEEFIEYAKGKSGVWFATCSEIADLAVN